MKCPICDKEYLNYGWFKRHMTKIHGWSEADALNHWSYHCPFCGVMLPDNIKICWGCGEVLDPHLLLLAEANKR